MVPDLTVICGEKELDGTKYIEVPPLIVEILTSLRKKAPTSKREGAPAPVKVGDECRLALANE